MLVSLLLISVISCSKGLSATFVNEENSKEHIELRTDRTFSLSKDGKVVFSGNYTYEKITRILLLSSGSRIVRWTLNGNILVDDEGKTWKKK
jgi:hypothetical protein